MFVRETRVQGPPDRVQEAIQNYEKTILPVVRKTPGNVGAALMVNRQTGIGIGVTYWESAKALAASEQMGNQARAQSAKDMPGSSVINVERAEVMIMDRVAPPMKGSMLRVNTLIRRPAEARCRHPAHPQSRAADTQRPEGLSGHDRRHRSP